MRIMTFNIWGDYFNNPCIDRVGGVVETVKKYSPDIVGMQEVTHGYYATNLNDLLCEDYYCLEAHFGSYTPIYYKFSEFELIECGFCPFKETPDSSKSITWAVLSSKMRNGGVIVLNTHWWYKERGEEDDLLRVKNAEQIVETVKWLKDKYGYPVFVFGDFNCFPNAPAFKVFERENMVRANEVAEISSDKCTYHGYPVLCEDGKFHGTETQNNKSFSYDHIVIFKNSVKVLKHDVICDKITLDVSDHSPVIVDVEL